MIPGRLLSFEVRNDAIIVAIAMRQNAHFTKSKESCLPMYPISFVCCIEAGRLENEVIGLATTLRNNGGEMSSASLTAVRGRKGPRLRRNTVETLAQLNVHIEDAHELNPLPWFNYSNKVAAVQYLEDAGATPPPCMVRQRYFLSKARR